jgi:hypothetical protein
MSVRQVAPLSGVVFVVLAVVAFVVLGGSTPDIKASPAKITSFYVKHHSKEEAAAHLLAIAVAFLAVFAASCWPLIRDAHRLWSALFFGGGLIAAAGFLVGAGIHLALADGANHHLDPASLQTLNALDSDDYIAFVVGIGIMLLGAAGAMIPLAGALRWLGWIALVLGIAVFTPAGFIGFIGSAVWIIVVSVVLFLRAAEGVTPAGMPGTAH